MSDIKMRLPSGERLFSPGRALGTDLRPVPASAIEAEARAAVQAGKRLDDACPWPFGSAAGREFKRVFFHLGGAA